MVQIIILFLFSGMAWRQADAVRVHNQGATEIYNNSGIDIDEGKLAGVTTTICADSECPPITTPGFKGSDFWFHMAWNRGYLSPQHGARFSKASVTSPGYAGCSTAKYVRGRVRVDSLPDNSAICMRTSEGRFAEIRIETYEAKAKSLKFSFTTWEKESEVPAKK
jgi:hypothetical protein